MIESLSYPRFNYPAGGTEKARRGDIQLVVSFTGGEVKQQPAPASLLRNHRVILPQASRDH